MNVRLNGATGIGLAMVLAIVLGSIVVPAISPFHPDRSAGLPLLPPSLEHPFGTDSLGRDVFVRAFVAARLDLFLATCGVVIPLAIGTAVGSIVGITSSDVLEGAWVIVVDAINALPILVIVVALVGVFGPGIEGLMLALFLTSWARYARIGKVRAQTLRNSAFVEAGRLLGYSGARIICRHIAPNVLSETVAYARSDFVIVIVLIAGLSFLGLGVRPPTPEWGAMMSEARLFVSTEPWLILFPGSMLAFLAVGFGLLTEGSLDYLFGTKR